MSTNSGGRGRILEYLETHGTATTAELARALSLTTANIRYHVRNLRRDGLIEEAGQRRAQTGRPARVYRRSPASTQRDDLIEALLDTFINFADEPQAALKQLAGQLAEQTGDPSKHISRRLFEAMPRLQALGYQAHWEAQAAGPEVIFGRCPYRPILDDHPELCSLDAHLLQALLAEPIEQTARLVPGKLGLPVCRFRTHPTP